jgi:exosortase
VVRPSFFLGGALGAFALFALWAGVAGAELYTQRMSLVLLIAGTVVYFWGLRFLQLIWVPLALLVLSIPIPAIIFNKIAFPLQLFASRCAVWSMSVLGIPVLRQGNVIELKPLNSIDTRKLEVVEACSGIRSLMTLMTLAVVFAYFTHPRSGKGGKFGWLPSYGFWRSTILVLSAVPIAILTNAARVSGTGILSHYYGTEVADGFFHSFSGWAIYIVAFLILFAVGWILDRFKPSPGPATSTETVGMDERTARDHAPGVATTGTSVAPAEGAE